jgi:hypothetical protein
VKYFLSTFSLLISLGLTGCGIGGYWMNGNPNHSPTYPYGAHWIKDGMTKESRRHDFKECGGDSVSFKAGYEKQPDQTTADYFEGLNKHTLKVHSCMRAKDYMYLEQCDTRCLYP